MIVRKILAIVPSILFWLAFALILGGFHLIQVITFHTVGPKARERSVEILNILLIRSLLLVGSRATFHGMDQIPEDRPLIVVANHQSMMDIPPVVWGFRRNKVRFISKKELGYGVPSISYHLRKSGSLLIDRARGSRAVGQITQYGSRMNQTSHAIAIYPEGTRNPKGVVRPFKPGGLLALIRSMPDAVIVPFVIDGNWRVFRSGMFPLELGHRIRYTALKPIEPGTVNQDELVALIRGRIMEKLGQPVESV